LIEIPVSTKEDEEMIEISFSFLKKKEKSSASNSYTVILRAFPRFFQFKRTDTVVDMKRKIY